MSHDHPAKYYNNRGYEATFEDGKWIATMRGYKTPDGRIIGRGGPAHPDDMPIAKFTLAPIYKVLSVDGRTVSGLSDLSMPVHETFHDVLLDSRDLLGAPAFRNKPESADERKLFAAAFDAAQKIRNSVSVLNVNHMYFTLNPSLFFFADCFARDKSGAFWLMFAVPQSQDLSSPDARDTFGLASYVLEAGEYVPANATVRIGAWVLSPTGFRFKEVSNDRVGARDRIIDYIMEPPF